MNDPNVFEDPHVFKPERFLDKETGIFQPHERVVPFGVGKRYCLGQSLAEKELYIFFAGLLQQFELHHPPGLTLPAYDMEETFPRSIIRTCPIYKILLKAR